MIAIIIFLITICNRWLYITTNCERSLIQILKSTNNVLDILFLMKDHNEKEIGLNEISRLTNINKSTVYKILVTLGKRNIVTQNPESKKYYLGHGLLELTNKVLKETNLYDVAHPIIKDLARVTEKTVTLGIRYDDHLVFIDRVDGNESVHFHCEIGKWMPFYEGAAAKALFAHLSTEEINNISNQLNHQNHLKRELKIERFFSQIKSIRELGYSTSDEEVDPGVLAFGAPIFDFQGNVIAGMALAGIKESVTDEKREILVSELINHSSKISSLLGYQKPTD